VRLTTGSTHCADHERDSERRRPASTVEEVSKRAMALNLEGVALAGVTAIGAAAEPSVALLAHPVRELPLVGMAEGVVADRVRGGERFVEILVRDLERRARRVPRSVTSEVSAWIGTPSPPRPPPPPAPRSSKLSDLRRPSIRMLPPFGLRHGRRWQSSERPSHGRSNTVPAGAGSSSPSRGAIQVSLVDAPEAARYLGGRQNHSAPPPGPASRPVVGMGMPRTRHRGAGQTGRGEPRRLTPRSRAHYPGSPDSSVLE
jgi:hypothetical protein